MGAGTIADALDKHYPKWLFYQEIVEITGMTKSSVTTCLRKMRKREEIEYKIVMNPKLRSRWQILYRYTKGGGV